MNQGIILVVDDEPGNIQLLSGILKGKFKVKAAKNGIKAIEIAHKEPQPDLILLDVMMPDMDGYEVCERLKGDPETDQIPIVFITGNASDEERQRGIAMGAVEYLIKPVVPETLIAFIEQKMI